MHAHTRKCTADLVQKIVWRSCTPHAISVCTTTTDYDGAGQSIAGYGFSRRIDGKESAPIGASRFAVMSHLADQSRSVARISHRRTQCRRSLRWRSSSSAVSSRRRVFWSKVGRLCIPLPRTRGVSPSPRSRRGCDV